MEISEDESRDKKKDIPEPKVTAKPIKDTEFDPSDMSSDDETTILKEEQLEETNHKEELDDLKLDGEMSIDDLMKKYTINTSDICLHIY